MERSLVCGFAISVFLFSQPAAPGEQWQPDLKGKCMGIGFLAKEAGEMRDKGVKRADADEILARSLVKADASRVEAAKMATWLPIALAYDNTKLQPWTLLTLGEKLCTFSSKMKLSEQTLQLITQYAYSCQRTRGHPEGISACMNKLDSMVEDLLLKHAKKAATP